MSGTAAENMRLAHSNLEKTGEAKLPVVEQIKEESAHRDELKLCVDRMTTKIARAEAANRLMERTAPLPSPVGLPRRRKKTGGNTLENMTVPGDGRTRAPTIRAASNQAEKQ